MYYNYTINNHTRNTTTNMLYDDTINNSTIVYYDIS